MKRTHGEAVFQVFNVIIMAGLLIITAYPLYYILCASFSSTTLLQTNSGLLFKPLQFTTGAYRLAFNHPLLLSGFKNTFLILIIALPINLLLTVLCSYFLASKGMMFKKTGIFLVLFTIFFNGGLIPNYLNIRDLKLLNTLWAVILPASLSVYNCIITKTAMEVIPQSLSESAYVDGANDFTVLFRIILPLIKPTLAVMVLYYGVGHWNSWFSATIYIQDNYKMPMQAILRAILIENQEVFGTTANTGDKIINDYTETIKYAVMVMGTIPILCVYPFLQKYFVKGVMIGAVKG